MTNNLNYYEKNRKKAFDFVKKYHSNDKVVVYAPPKSGKREFMIIESLLNKNKNSVSIMVTSLDRKDNKVQFEELKSYGISCFLTSVKKNKIIDLVNKEHQNFISQNKKENLKLYLNFDECDYGSDIRQKAYEILKFTINECKKLNIHLCYRFISASVDELIYSKLMDMQKDIKIKGFKLCKYIPPPNFIGLEKNVKNGLLHQAFPFFEFDHKNNIVTSPHGRVILDDFKNSNKSCAIIRMSCHSKGMVRYNDIKTFSFCEELRKKGFIPVFVDKDNPMNWGEKTSDKVNSWYDYIKQANKDNKKIIFFINQTCTRSTEIRFHPLIDFYHDYRKDSTAYNTIIQAAGRVNHYRYDKSYSLDGFQFWGDNANSDIKVYTDVTCAKLYAGLINDDDFSEQSGGKRLSQRVRKNKGKKNKVFLNKETVLRIIHLPDEIRNKFKEAKKSEDRKRILNKYRAEHLLEGLEEYKKHYAKYSNCSRNHPRTTSGNGRDDVAAQILNKDNQFALIFVDGPSKKPKFYDSYAKLLAAYGTEIIGNLVWLEAIDDDIDDNVQKPYETKNSMYDAL